MQKATATLKARLHAACPPLWLHRTLILPILMVAFVAFCFVFVGPIWHVFHMEGVNAQAIRVYCAVNVTRSGGNVNNDNGCAEYQYLWNDHDFSNFTDDEWMEAPTVLWMRVRITNLDLEAGTATLMTELHPSGDMYGMRGALNLTTWLDTPINYTSLVLIYNNVNHTFENGQRPGRFTTDILLNAKRNLMDYPFDEYNALIDIQVWASNGNPSEDSYVPIIYQLNTALPAFTLQADMPHENTNLYVDPDMTYLFPGLYITRSITTKFFSMFIVISMWALSGATFVYVIDLVYLRPRQAATDDASFVTALLFALPSVRSAQPGVPNVGASVDVAGFIWNMVLAAVSGVIIVAALYAQHNPSQPRRSNDDQVLGDEDCGSDMALPRQPTANTSRKDSAAPLLAPPVMNMKQPTTSEHKQRVKQGVLPTAEDKHAQQGTTGQQQQQQHNIMGQQQHGGMEQQQPASQMGRPSVTHVRAHLPSRDGGSEEEILASPRADGVGSSSPPPG